MRHGLMKQQALINNCFESPNYESIHQVKKQRRGGGVLLYIHQFVMSKIRNNLSINFDDVKSISGETLFENTKTAIFSVFYRQLKGDKERFEKFLKKTFSRINDSNK